MSFMKISAAKATLFLGLYTFLHPLYCCNLQVFLVYLFIQAFACPHVLQEHLVSRIQTFLLIMNGRRDILLHIQEDWYFSHSLTF
jgi:hypothetical protein